MNEVMIFHLKGKMAHFRRYYSNSSALSYTIPPRTTICGILAGLLGMERDSYYEDFSLEKCDLAVGLTFPVRKVVQKMNLLMVKKSNDLNGSQPNHSQCPTELLMPENIRTGDIGYKIWLRHSDEGIMKKLRANMETGGNCYKSLGISVALGSAQNLGWIEYGGMFKASDHMDFDGYREIDSVIPMEKLIDIEIEKEGYFLVKEEVPLEFDSERKLTARGKGHMLINRNARAVRAKVNEFTELENGDNIVWM